MKLFPLMHRVVILSQVISFQEELKSSREAETQPPSSTSSSRTPPQASSSESVQVELGCAEIKPQNQISKLGPPERKHHEKLGVGGPGITFGQKSAQNLISLCPPKEFQKPTKIKSKKQTKKFDPTKYKSMKMFFKPSSIVSPTPSTVPSTHPVSGTVQHSTEVRISTTSVQTGSVRREAAEHAEILTITENISHLAADQISTSVTAQQSQASHGRSRDTPVPPTPTNINTFTFTATPVARTGAEKNGKFCSPGPA